MRHSFLGGGEVVQSFQSLITDKKLYFRNQTSKERERWILTGVWQLAVETWFVLKTRTFSKRCAEDGGNFLYLKWRNFNAEEWKIFNADGGDFLYLEWNAVKALQLESFS